MMPASPILFGALALGWLPTGARWSDTALPVPYCITANGTNTNVSASGQRQAILGGIEAWTSIGSGGSVSCTTYTAQAATYSCTPGVNSSDAQPNISWETAWGNGSSAIGVTWTAGTGRSCGSVTDDTGRSHSIQCTYDSDIELNDRDFYWTDTTANSRTDIQSIVTHEYGHFLGLDHCSENGTCGLGTGVMNAAYPGGLIRVPFADDIQGVCGLYPGTPGGLGYPCQTASECTSGLCVGSTGNQYCTETCGSCPSGYVCGANPSNASQQVCLRDDGLNRDVCEVCQLSTANACANGGLCMRGLPETAGGRCILPCGTGGSCDTNFQCLTVSFQGGGTGDYCFPRSNDCTNLGNVTELQLGQRCDGTQPCATGLTCVGICAPSCAGGETCPSGWACETGFQTGAYCLPGVTEGQECSGLVTCEPGPCLSSSTTNATCYRDCAGNPSACNNAQSCNTYNLQGGGQVSICEPPGVPPNAPDAGVIVPDAGADDAGTAGADDAGSGDAGSSAADSGIMSMEDAGTGGGATKVGSACACDTTYSCDPSGNSPCECDPECGCLCDKTFACDPGCGSCDPECLCECDLTYACDEGCEACDPECSASTSSCTCTLSPGASGWSGLLLLGLGTLLWRRRREQPL